MILTAENFHAYEKTKGNEAGQRYMWSGEIRGVSLGGKQRREGLLKR